MKALRAQQNRASRNIQDQLLTTSAFRGHETCSLYSESAGALFLGNVFRICASGGIVEPVRFEIRQEGTALEMPADSSHSAESPPQWIRLLVDEISAALHLWVDAPLECHIGYDLDRWEITLFLNGEEFVGGVLDGRRSISPFTVDLLQLQRIIEVAEISWQAHAVDLHDDLRTHLSVIGIYRGERVWLRILANPPLHIPVDLQDFPGYDPEQLDW